MEPPRIVLAVHITIFAVLVWLVGQPVVGRKLVGGAMLPRKVIQRDAWQRRGELDPLPFKQNGNPLFVTPPWVHLAGPSRVGSNDPPIAPANARRRNGPDPFLAR